MSRDTETDADFLPASLEQPRDYSTIGGLLANSFGIMSFRMKVLLEIVVCIAFWYLLLLIAIIRRNGKFYIIFVINNRV